MNCKRVRVPNALMVHHSTVNNYHNCFSLECCYSAGSVSLMIFHLAGRSLDTISFSRPRYFERRCDVADSSSHILYSETSISVSASNLYFRVTNLTGVEALLNAGNGVGSKIGVRGNALILLGKEDKFDCRKILTHPSS